MAEKLKINAVICDIRNLKEEVLASYDEITIDAVNLVANTRARAMLAKYPVTVSAVRQIDVADDVHVSTVNGKLTLTGASIPNGKQFLMVNGSLTVTPDAGDALRQYIGIFVNGSVLCPESLGTTFSSVASMNGKLTPYPDNAIILKPTTVIDRFFTLRAQPRLYWAQKRFIAVDSALDGAALAAKGVRFAANEAVLTESLAESLASCFTEDTQLIIVPDETTVVQGDLALTPAEASRCGSSLYVPGDMTISPDCEDDLDRIDFLHVGGDVCLPDALADAFLAIPDLEYGNLLCYKGRLFRDRRELRIEPSLLDVCPDGLTVMDCTTVTLDEALSPADILDRLTLIDCVTVNCTPAQLGAVIAIAEDITNIQTTEDADNIDDTEDKNSDVHVIDAVMYEM